MKLLSCDLCDEAFAAATFEEWMQLMMPHYMTEHADFMEANKDKPKEEQAKWMTKIGQGLMPLKANQIALVVLSFVAIFLYWQKYQDVYKDTGRLQVFQEGDAVILSWSSLIELPMERRFQEAYSEWAGKADKFIINLDSGGGALREGRLVIDVIDQMKKTHLVETTVGEGANCLSMCVPIYLHGEQRSASRNSRWMFHEPSAYDYITDEKVEENEADRNAASDRFFQKYFVNSEMDPKWRNELQKEWVGKDVWRTGQQLVDEQSNIILKLY